MTAPDPPRRPRRTVDVGSLYSAFDAPKATPVKALTNSLGMAFALVPPGSFRMGSAGPAPRRNESPARDVILTAGFYLAAAPVSARDFLAVCPRPGVTPDDRPMVDVSWDDAAAFCARLALLPAEGGNRYRLPTEAEWEYACRAGTATDYSTGDALAPDQAAFRGSGPGDGPPAASRFPANSFGLAAMHGTVWEWCADYYAPYPPGQVRDPQGPGSGGLRVLRGGSWGVGAACCRSAYRNALAPHQSDAQTGFRVVLVPGG